MKSKFYLRENTADLKNTVKTFFEAKKAMPDLKLVYLIPQEELLESSLANSLESALEELQTYGVDLSSLTVSVESEEKVLTESEWYRLQLVQENLSMRGIDVGVEDYGKTWTLKEVERANNSIEKVANKIKKHNFSPIEKLLKAYISVTQRDYRVEEENEDPSISRSIYGVLNSNKIVCVGYSSLLKAIMASVDDKNIQLVENTIATSVDGLYADGYHRDLIVHIKDEKYGINGYFLLDPTWDSKNKICKLNFFLVPLEDIDNLKTIILDRSTKTIEKAGKTQKKSKKSEFYKVNKGNTVSFSSDGFKINSEFLKILKINNPELFKKYQDEYVSFVITKLYNDYEKNVEVYKSAFKKYEKAGFNFITKKEKEDILFKYSQAKENNDYNIFNSELDNIIENRNKTFNDNVLGSLDEIVEERARVFQSIEYDNLDEYKEVSSDFSLKLHEFLQKNPELIEKLKILNLRKTLPIVKKYDVNSSYEDVFEKFKEQIESQTEPFNQNAISVYVDEKIKDEIENFKPTLENLASYLESQTERVKNDLLPLSKPVSRDSLLNALYEVLKENNPEKPRDEVYMKTLAIIDANTRASKRYYTGSAKNSFAREYYEHNM